jgi:hypothetical protein
LVQVNLSGKLFQKSFLLVSFCLVFLLGYAFASSVISARQFGIAGLLLFGCLYIVLIYSYKSARLPGHQSKPSNLELDSALGKVRLAVVVLPVLLVTGLWFTRGEPLLPRLTGAAINLLIMVWLIILLRKAKKKVDSA